MLNRNEGLMHKNSRVSSVVVGLTLMAGGLSTALADDPCSGLDGVAAGVASQLNKHLSQVAGGGEFRVRQSQDEGVPTANEVEWIHGGRVVFSETVTAGSDADGWVELKVLEAPAVGIKLKSIQGTSIVCKSSVSLQNQRFTSGRSASSAKSSGPANTSMSSSAEKVAHQLGLPAFGGTAALLGQLGATGTTKKREGGQKNTVPTSSLLPPQVR